MCRCQGTAYANVHSTTAILSTGLRGLQFWWANPQFVGQNGRPLMGPQMWMSSLVLTIHNFGVPNFDPYPFGWTPICWSPNRRRCNARCMESSSTFWHRSQSSGARTWGWPDQYPIWDHPNWIFMQEPSVVFGMFRRVSCGRAGRAVRLKVGSVGHVSYQPCPQCSGCITCHG